MEKKLTKFDTNVKKFKITIQLSAVKGTISREGVIIECPLNGQFNNARDVILTSQTDVR